jgi:hypothetical protein
MSSPENTLQDSLLDAIMNLSAENVCDLYKMGKHTMELDTSFSGRILKNRPLWTKR